MHRDLNKPGIDIRHGHARHASHDSDSSITMARMIELAVHRTPRLNCRDYYHSVETIPPFKQSQDESYGHFKSLLGSCVHWTVVRRWILLSHHFAREPHRTPNAARRPQVVPCPRSRIYRRCDPLSSFCRRADDLRGSVNAKRTRYEIRRGMYEAFLTWGYQ